MKLTTWTAQLCIAVAVTAQGANAQDAPPCSDAAFAQLDFWVGDWIAEWDVANGQVATGRNSIKKTLNGCVVDEHFRIDGEQPFVGRSYSTYVAADKKWAQTWVDTAGAYLLFEGDLTATPPALYQTNEPAGKPQRRMIWEDITGDGYTWRWQKSDDGEPTGAWEDTWVIRYRKATP